MTEKKHVKSAGGWAKLGIQLPDHIAEQFRDLAAEAGLGGSKTLMTAAVAILVAMPEADRDALVRFVIQKTYKRSDALDPEDVLNFFRFMNRPHQESAEVKGDPRWEVLYIADPELTPEPGNKASDRAARDAAKGQGKERA